MEETRSGVIKYAVTTPFREVAKWGFCMGK
jgi:hypothetical protein